MQRTALAPILLKEQGVAVLLKTGDLLKLLSIGSLFEVKHWLRRAYKRKLLAETNFINFQELIDELTPKLNVYINSIERKTTNDSQLTTNNSH